MAELQQTIRYCKAPDGRAIAWSTMGSGPPLLFVREIGHLGWILRSPVDALLVELARTHTVVNFDGLGSGLSDRSLEDFSLESCISQVEAVVAAAQLDSFALLTNVAGAMSAISYAARHPQLVSRMVSYGAMASGLMHRNPTPKQLAQRDLLLAAIECSGWDDPAFGSLHLQQHFPHATRAEQQSMFEAGRDWLSSSAYVTYLRWVAQIDVTEAARQIKCPVLVLHARGDRRIPFEEGQRLASLFADARLVPVESHNTVALRSEPIFGEVVAAILEFLTDGRHSSAGAAAFAALTPREHEVIELLAQGKDNLQIAAHLGLSEKTVRNHITPIFDKLQVENRSQAIVRAREAGLGKGKPAA